MSTKRCSTALVNNKHLKYAGKVVLTGSLLVFLSSCSSQQQDDVVCQVQDHALTESMLEELVNYYADEYSPDHLRERVIERWAFQKQIELAMEDQRPQQKRWNELRSRDELTDLHRFDLENNYIAQQLDSSVSDQEIQTYYDNHRDQYKSESYIVRALYIRIPDSVALQVPFEDHFLLKNDKDEQLIQKYAKLYAENFYFERDKWIYFDDLTKEIPMSNNKKQNLILQKGASIFHVDDWTYFINVIDYRSKSVSSPMQIEKNNIKKRILKRRINALRQEATETIAKNVKEQYPLTLH
ncbi:MAG: hypothetical protein ACQERC_00925 [Bacteroidota bacterium]